MSTKANNFESNIEQLEKIVENLESNDLDLDKALKQFEQGIKLVKSCQISINKAEQKIQILTQDNKLEDFNQDVNE
tara:strand:+ start:6150 stop:6377 length:228 start_codon:yes stop_codon:yes gene_type:complete